MNFAYCIYCLIYDERALVGAGPESGLPTITVVVVPLSKGSRRSNGQVERQDRLDLGHAHWSNLAAHEAVGGMIGSCAPSGSTSTLLSLRLHCALLILLPSSFLALTVETCHTALFTPLAKNPLLKTGFPS